MATMYDTSTMKPVEVPDDGVPDAFKSGRYGFAEGSKVVLFDRSGRSWDVPAESAHEAFAKGWTMAPQAEQSELAVKEKYGALGGQLLAGAAGAARGVSFGMSDRIARNLGVKASDLAGLKEAYPATSTGSEIIGAALPILASGGTGAAATAARGVGVLPRLAAKLSTAVGEKAAAKIAGDSLLRVAGRKALEYGVAGGIEGGLYGAGSAITEEALGGHEATAESVLAHAGLGALIGAGSGVLIGGGGALLSGGGRKAVSFAAEKLGDQSTTVKQFLEDFAGERALKATLGQQKRAFTQLEEKGLKKKAQKYILEDIGISGKDTTESLAEKLVAKRDEIGKRLDDIVSGLDEATAGNLAERVSPAAVAAKIEKEVAEPLKKIAANQAEYKAVMREVKAIKNLGKDGISFADARAQRAAIQDKINYDRLNGLTAAAGAKNKIARIWNDVIDETAEPVLKRMGEQTNNAYKAARDEFSLVKRLSDYAENRVRGNEANRFISPSDYGVGAAMGLADVASGGGVSVAKGIASAGAHKIIREHANAAMAAAAYRLSKIQGIQRASDAINKRIGTAADKYVARAVSSGKLVGRVGTETAKGEAFANLDTDDIGTVSRFDAVRTLMNSSWLDGKKREHLDRRLAVKERSDELAQLVTDPSRLANKISASTSGMAEAAPNVSDQIAMKAAKAVQYLHDKAPKNPRPPNPVQPLSDNWRPTNQEVSRFERRVRAAFDPMSVIKDLEHGVLTKEGVETLRDLYPELHKMTLKTIAMKLAETKERLPYKDRVNLSLLFGVPLDETMRPDFIRRTQALWSQKPNQGQGAGGQRVSALGKLGLADGVRTETQKREVAQ